MKPDKRNQKAIIAGVVSTPVETDLEGLTSKKDSLLVNRIWLSILPVLSVLTVVGTGLLSGISEIEIMKISILTLILSTATVFYLRMQMYDILGKKHAKGIILVSYLGSIVLIMLPIKPDILSFWMIGGFIIAVLIDNKLGLLTYINLTFILCVFLSLGPETAIHYLVIAVLLGLLSGALGNKSTFIYASIIILSTNITLAFVLNNFIFEKDTNFNYVSSFFSILTILITVFLLSLLYGRILKKEGLIKAPAVDIGESLAVNRDGVETGNERVEEQATETNTEKETDLQSTPDIPALITTKEHGARTSYEVLVQEDNELLQKIREYSEFLYRHCLKTADISQRAAHAVGADELLSRAGGLYHEAGKINGKDYIVEGLKLAEEYAFPKELKSIIRQHNIKYDKPTSVEAVIVMLSDNLLSTFEYIKKQGDNKLSPDKVIDNIFQMRMEKGTFDEAGLSVKDFKLLKAFYHNEFKQG